MLHLAVEQSGAVEVCWAHNPEVRGSKPRSAKGFFLYTLWTERTHGLERAEGPTVQMAEWSKARGSRIRSYPLIGDFSSSHEGGGSNPPLDIIFSVGLHGWKIYCGQHRHMPP